MIVGIDPGLSGGIGFVNDHPIPSEAFVMPILAGRIDLRGLKEIFDGRNPSLVIIELAQVMPKQNAVSGFTCGVNYGMLIAFLTMNQIPYQEVRPMVWKPKLGLPKKEKTESVKQVKDRSIALARKLFPAVNMRETPRCRTDHDGIAEALLLAEYGRRFVAVTYTETVGK